MRRPLLLAGVLLLIASAVIFLLQQEEPGMGAAANGTQSPAEKVAGAEMPKPADGASPTQEPGVGRTEARVETPGAGASVGAEHPGPWLDVEVVSGPAALPAPFARVMLLTPEESRQEELMMSFLTGVTVPELLSQQGETHVTDKSGRARVPMPLRPGLIAAELDNGFVLKEWEPSSDATAMDGALRLVLEPSTSVDILVVNAAGQPVVGAPVSIRFGDENFQMDFLRDQTGADGIARMKHVPMFLGTFMPGMELPCHVALLSPLPTPVAAPLNLRELPTSPIKLVMPDTGRLEIATQLVDGTPVADGQIVFLSRPSERPEDDDDFFIAGLPGFDSIAVRTSGGVAVFGFVGLGMDLQATSVFPAAPESTQMRGRGPERAGETTRWMMKESLDFPILTGQLLDAAGVPLAGRNAALSIPDEVNEFGMEPSRKLTTGADGSFRIAMRSHEMLPRPQPAEFMIDGATLADTLQVGFEIPPLGIGENSVGSLRARPAPVLAAGRILGVDGAALPGATVCKMNWMQWDEDDLSQGIWVENYGNEVACAPDGSFTLFGAPRATGLRLLAEAPGYLQKEVEAIPGVRNLEIRLSAGGTLRGRLLADEGIPLDDFVITLELVDQRMSEDSQRWASIDGADGNFSIEGLSPGVGTLSVRTGWGSDDDTRIARIEGIALGPDAVPDPRLDPLDLRGRLHACRVHAKTEDGEVISEFQVWLEEDSESQFHGWNGEVTVMSVKPLVRVVVSAPGFRLSTVDAVKSEIEVTLRKGPELLLRLPPSAARCDDVALGVQISRLEESDSGWNEDPRGFFEPDGTLRLRVQEPGNYAVIFLAERGRNSNAQDWNFTWIPQEEGVEYQNFTVNDAAGIQAFSLSAPSKAIVLAALAEDEAEAEAPFDPFQR